MPHRIDTAMEGMQLATCNPSIDRASPDLPLPKLATRDHPVLPVGQHEDEPIDATRDAFFIPQMNNASLVRHAADAGGAMRTGGTQKVRKELRDRNENEAPVCRCRLWL
jgi:hypothetical protein